jgi:hypothetical protein
MYYGFQTEQENAAIAALLVYGVYRSRDIKRFKITPDMWSMIERAVKSSAKRALDLTDFIEKFKPKMHCPTIHPRYMKLNEETLSMVRMPDGSIIQKQDQGQRREFWAELMEEADNEEVLLCLYKKTSLIIALVRDRLEREKPIEAVLEKEVEKETLEYSGILEEGDIDDEY